MASVGSDLDNALVAERKIWLEGPPHELFKQLRSECPVHWSQRISDYPGEPGFWSVTTADDVHTVSRDWRTYSSELGGVTAVSEVFPIELTRAMFIGMDPPKHDRIKALFQAASHPSGSPTTRIDPRDRHRHAGRIAGREGCDLVNDVAQPVVSRVIGSFMGIPEEDDAIWARLMNSTLAGDDKDINPDGIEGVLENDIPEIFERCRSLIAERRENPTDDLTTVLVDAEVDGEKLEEHEIVMGFFLLMAAGDDSTKATYCSGMQALIKTATSCRSCSTIRRSCRAPWRSRCGCSPPSRTSVAPPPAIPSCTDSRSERGRRSSCGTSPQTATSPATRTPITLTSLATPSTRPSVRGGATSVSERRWRDSS